MLESLKEKFCCKSRTETCNITIGHLLKNGVSNHLYTTKYSLLNFLPKFFYAQFTEPSNLFFLILTLIQLYPGISPFAWHTSGFPLIVIISVNALIEIYEDMKRRLSDQRVNNTKVEALDFKTGEWQFLKWKDLRESQLVRLGSDDKVPADLILLSSSEPGGIIYMETSNLDGEASLKIRQATPYTLAVDSIERVKILVDSESEIHYEAPSRALDRFQGVLKIKKDILPMTSRWSDRSCLSINGDEKCAHVPLSASNLIFRGATIQNTDWLLGVVVHAGRSTKLAKNSIKKSSKTSIIHRLTSWMVVTQIGWLLLMSAPIAFWSKTGDESWFKTYYGDVGGVQSTMFGLFLAELILFSNLVPISLYITIEGCLMWQAYYLGQDLFLYDETRDQRVEVRSFKMIPNLGRVKYVLSDKTGTLTTNTMCFKFCSIGGQKYGKRSSKGKEFNTDKLLKELRLNAKGNSNSIDLFLLACAVCHTVVVDKKKNDASKEHGETSLSNIVSLRMTVPDSPQPKKPRESIFHACSPDEKCLVKFAKQARYAFTARTPDSISVEVNGVCHVFQLLAMIEFNSNRKRMTVIVRTPEGKLCLFVKGADVKIMEMLSPSSDPKVRSTTQAHLKEFANLGYRTLCFAYRDLDEEEYRNWAQIWSRANCELYDREEAIEKAAKIVEKEFILLGASAIEDKLQERVPQTIARMLQADIRVWVLTGDKLETALNIGYSCSLISSKMPTMILATNTEEETAAQLEKYVNALGSKRLDSRDVELALIVDAMCLDWILKSQVMRMDFLRLALCCSAVICCRCTPLQKAAVTRLVKHNVDGQVLAVGDGANDVAMIQEANIGIGIAGVEGGQASMAADFSITQFRHLDRLLFVHGTCCFHRITTVVLFSLYKNLFEVLLHVLYAFYNGHSASGMSDEVLMVRYNLLYTSVTVAILGIHDTPAPLHVMSKYPRLYTHFQDNMNIRNHLSWSANALLHAFLLFHTTLYFWKYGTGAFRNGRDGWGQMVGSYMYLCLVVIVNLKAMIESRSINILTVAGFLGSILTALIMLATDSVVATLWSFPIVIPSQAHYLGLLWALPSVQTTAFLPLICVICLLPDVAWKAISRTLDPSLLQHVVQSMKVNDNVLDMVIKQPLIKIADVVGLKSHLESGKYGFMFAQDDGHVMTQADLLRMYGAADCIPETQTPASPVGKTTFLSETSSLKSLSLGADGPSNENRESRLTTKDSGAKCVVLDETGCVNQAISH